MNLFEMHNGKDEQVTKDAILMIITKNVSKYIVAQKETNIILVGGDFKKKCKPKKKCTLCRVDEVLSEMARFQGIVKEACKTYTMLFKEEVDLEAIITKCKNRFYNAPMPKKSNKVDRSKGYPIPADAPQEVVDVCNMIQDALRKSGSGAKMEVIDISADNYGLRKDDFDNDLDFFQAVSQARMENDEKYAGKSGEEILTEAVLQKVEDDAEEEIETPSSKVRKDKLN